MNMRTMQCITNIDASMICTTSTSIVPMIRQASRIRIGTTTSQHGTSIHTAQTLIIGTATEVDRQWRFPDLGTRTLTTHRPPTSARPK